MPQNAAPTSFAPGNRGSVGYGRPKREVAVPTAQAVTKLTSASERAESNSPHQTRSTNAAPTTRLTFLEKFDRLEEPVEW